MDASGYVCVRATWRRLPDGFIARARAEGLVAFDTETDSTSSANADLCGVSLAVTPGEACYIPVGHGGEADEGLQFAASDLQQLPLDQVIARLKPLFEDPGVIKIAHNVKYDLAVLSRYGIAVSPIEDTMLISYVLEAGLHDHGMADLAKLWLDHEPISLKSVTGSGKAQKSFRHAPLEAATAYAAEDADVTVRLYHHLRPRLAREGVLSVYETLERPLPAVLAQRMECEG